MRRAGASEIQSSAEINWRPSCRVMEVSRGLAEAQVLSPEQAARYLRYVKEAKEATKNGDLEEAFKLFNLAKDIFPNEKVMSRIQKIQEALEALADPGDDEFTDVCSSGLLLYRELHDQLFEHQKEGVAFLYSLYRDGRKGGILADDMGLGKTVQIIAFLSGMFDASLVNHVLLIMPTSLISTWVKEFDKWTPGMRVKTFHGPSKDERTRNLRRIQHRNGVIITTYQMLINNWQQLSSLDGQEFVWDYVILDEAHKIKTSSTKSALCARAVPASNRILLTGTPIQNNLQELWSLFDFACQGSLLGTLKTFKMEYENPITRAREKDATPGEKALGLKISENLMAIIKPYFLRRTKEEVQKKRPGDPEVRLSEKNPGVDATNEMPSLSRKNDLIIWIRLVPLQEEIYRKFVSLDHIKELLMETRSPLAELGVLKKLCDHPRLLSARACHLLNLEDVTFSVEDEGEDKEASDVDHISQVTDVTLMKESGKMIFLMDLLERLRDEGHQTLVFSQSRQILNIIERLLKNRHFKILRIDGTITHLVEREKRINLFQQNKDYSVFLITTQVGGVGLTLTAATRVVIFDPSWNPATDAQAVDRAHRIGQRENVVVYRLITCGTVEEKIYRRQVFKDSLIRQTTGDKKNPFRYFSKQELRELFAIEDFQKSATQLQLQSLHAAQRRSDRRLDEHIAYLHTLGIAGVSDHDLMYTQDLSAKEELDVIEESQYIQQRVQKAQFLVECESQNTELLLERERAAHQGLWRREAEFPSQTKAKRPESKKPQAEPSAPPSARLTWEEEISSQMARVALGDLPETGDKAGLPSIEMSGVVPQDARLPRGTELGAEFAEAPPAGSHSVEEISTDFSLGVAVPPRGQAPPGSPTRSSRLSLSTSATADLAPNVDEVQDVAVSQRWDPRAAARTTQEQQSTRSDASGIDTAATSDLSAPRGAPADVAAAGGGSAASSPQYACDFNLFLEDSADSGRDPSSRSSELVEKAGSSAARVGAEFVRSHARLSAGLSGDDQEPEEVVTVKGGRKTRRIVSDDEDDGDSFRSASGTDSLSTSPFRLPVKFFDASTPKSDVSPPGRFFSPLLTDSINKSAKSRRSLASRRSVVNLVLDHVEDMEDGVETSAEAQGAAPGPRAGAEESSGEASDSAGEEPSRETLSPENKSSWPAAPQPDALIVEASPGGSGSPEPPTAAQAVGDPQGEAARAARDYESLVARGKALREAGRLQEALSCFVEALDIRSADPEVMLMTLSLYKQLNST
ncbi:DNA excision repair protein ERCC-6-like [Pteropus medius]|uniref:DNA excision repair protein ERCC-6-like n=1 Tax=Pteropus vampyrus TaxID=132908 RepID=UPI00196AE43F|nr:DNA excision repair protein ERCC-6-like [Pteropus giganteus]